MPRPAPPSQAFPSFWTLHLSGWAVLGFAMWIGVLTHVDDPLRALAGKMAFAVIGGVLTLGLRPLYRRLHRRGLSIPALVGVSAVCSYLLSLVWSILHTLSGQALNVLFYGDAFEIPAFRWLIDGALFFSFIFVAWSVLYFALKYYQGLQAARERALAAEGMAHQAHLQALRYQLNPHFLFNTLNAISTLIAEHENRSAERMVARLSDFLRLTLESDGAAEVPLAEEVDFARRYLDIEQIRFGDRLRVTFDVDADTLAARVPPLLLQPLVENAVRHGILPREEGGALTLEARRAGDRLLLRVADDGPGPSTAATAVNATAVNGASGGVGLANVRERLAAHYGDDFRFALERADGGGCAARIDLPFRAAAGDEATAAPMPRPAAAFPPAVPVPPARS